MIVTKLHEFAGHSDSIYTAAFNAETQQLYTAGGDGMVAIWNTVDRGDGALLVRVGFAVYSMCLLYKKLLLGNRMGNLYIIDTETKTEERNIEAHSQGVFDIVFDTEVGLVYSCGFDGVLQVWDAKFNLVHSIKLSTKSLRCICLLPGKIAVAASDFTVYILDKQTFEISAKLKSHTNSVFALAYNPIEQELLSGGRDCYIKIWDTKSWLLKREYIGAKLHINHISFNSDFSNYAVSSMDKTIKIFDAETHEPLKFIDKEKNNGHTSSVNKSLWLKQNSLISISDDKKAIQWSLKL